ncbi:MAG: response regulator [Endozoicomonas sp. (ex Botrylloides leachii)]|nr:response regulator [Endozoicomonas sp. (ex Botrylloides leachii)]
MGPSKLNTEMLAGKQVLVAEDNTANQLVLKRLLKKVGIEPVFANNGQEIMSLYKAEPEKWHLLLMDCEMPVMDGYHATEGIREYEVEQAINPIHIIGLSAHAITEFKKKALDVGMDDYLTKPLDRDLLFQTLDKYLHAD